MGNKNEHIYESLHSNPELSANTEYEVIKELADYVFDELYTPVKKITTINTLKPTKDNLFKGKKR